MLGVVMLFELSSLQSFLAAANDLQIKGLTTPTVNSFRKNTKLEEDNTVETPAKKNKKERSDPESNKVNRSLLKRRNTEICGQEEIKQEDETDTLMEEEEENMAENFDSQAEENSYEELSQDHDGASFQLENGHFSGSQTDDVAAG